MNKKPTTLALSIIILQIMTWLNVAAFVILLGIFIYGFTIDPDVGMLSIAMLGKFAMAIVGLIFAVLFYYTEKGLLNQKKWARITTIIIGVFMLFGFPIGTIIGLLLIYGVTKGWPNEVQEEINKSNVIS
jgi:phosphoglycerol transferase MdoB-like AlkP superfamily enzyme